MVANPIAMYGPAVVITDSAAALPSIDCTQGSQFTVTLTGTGRTMTLINPIPGQIVYVKLVQDATGSRTITTYTNVLWAGGTKPTLTTAAAGIDLIQMVYDSTAAKWFASSVGLAFS